MKQAISSPNAPQAIGPYSQAVRIGNLLFLSGQIPLDPATGKLVGDSLTEQTHRVMKNLGGVLKSANLTFDHIVRTTIYMVNLHGFKEVNQVYATYFKEPYPARATVQVADLPASALLEIDAIAVYE